MAEIARAPLMWPVVRGDARRRLVRRFPYAVIYLAEPEHIEVLAVFHSSRDPKQWHGRVASH
jgi:plasmid stabilization system protein ParE